MEQEILWVDPGDEGITRVIGADKSVILEYSSPLVFSRAIAAFRVLFA